MAVLVDTGVVYAFLNQDDEHHDLARALVEDLLRGRYGAPILLDLVVSELFTLVRARGGPPALEDRTRALALGGDAAPSPFRIHCVELADLPAIASCFLATRTRGFSFVDAALVVLRETLGVDAVATFDKGLRQATTAL